MKNMIFLSLLLLGVVSCKESILGSEPSGDSPVDIFETYWKDLDRHYALFEVRNVDWNSLYTTYRPMVSDDISSDSLWNVISTMSNHLKDRHVALIDKRNNKTFISGVEFEEQSRREFSLGLTENSLEHGMIHRPHYDILYSKVANHDIGYLHIGSLHEYDIGLLDNALAEVTKYRALILDLRQNSGGYGEYIEKVLSWLSDNDNTLFSVQSRNGNSHSDFSEKRWSKNVKARSPYPGQVVVLTDRATVSAGEWLLCGLKSCNNVIHLGDTTSGCLSTLSTPRFLPNGWIYAYSIQKVVMVDGSIVEGIGFAPDIYVKNDEDQMYVDQNDSVIIAAINFLTNDHSL